MIDSLHKFDLKNKTAFVVGGLGLIGREVSTAFALAGAKIVVLDIESEKKQLFLKKLNDMRCDVIFKNFDCAEMKMLDNNFSTVINENSCPNIFINCSYPCTEDWGDSSFGNIMLESFRKNVDIHMNSYAWLARLAAEEMVKAGNGGSIIQLGSIYGIVGQDLTIYKETNMHENMTYAAIKGGITSLTRQMASYYGQFNIRVNTLCPGGLEGHVAGKSDTQNPLFVKNYCRKVPLKRLGKAKEIASVAHFLASEAASYVTGATIMVDGGWTTI